MKHSSRRVLFLSACALLVGGEVRSGAARISHLIASSNTLSPADFRQNNYRFSDGWNDAAVVNRGGAILLAAGVVDSYWDVGNAGLAASAGSSTHASRAAISACSTHFAALDAHGDARIGGLFAYYPLLLTRDFSVTANIAADRKSLRDRVGALSTEAGKNITPATAGLSGNLRRRGGAYAFSLAHTGGVAGVGASERAIRARESRRIGEVFAGRRRRRYAARELHRRRAGPHQPRAVRRRRNARLAERGTVFLMLLNFYAGQ